MHTKKEGKRGHKNILRFGMPNPFFYPTKSFGLVGFLNICIPTNLFNL